MPDIRPKLRDTTATKNPHNFNRINPKVEINSNIPSIIRITTDISGVLIFRVYMLALKTAIPDRANITHTIFSKSGVFCFIRNPKSSKLI